MTDLKIARGFELSRDGRRCKCGKVRYASEPEALEALLRVRADLTERSN